MHAFFARIATNPAAYGFKHPMEDDSCRGASLFSLDCFTKPARWKSADANATYILVGMVHFTARTEALVADYVFQAVGGNAGNRAIVQPYFVSSDE